MKKLLAILMTFVCLSSQAYAVTKVPAKDVTVDTSDFGDAIPVDANTVQKALQAVNDNGTGGGGTPGGSQGEFQYNNNGNFAGGSMLTTANSNVGINTAIPTQRLEVGGTVKSTGAIIGSLTGILKGTSGTVSAATSGTDYAPATSGTSILYGNGAGGFSNVTIGSNLTFVGGTLDSTGGGSSQFTTINTKDVYLPNSGNIGLGTSATTTSALTIMNGNVGIGTWKPTAPLSVGGITANSFQVSSTGQVNLGSIATNGTANLHNREINSFDLVYNFDGVSTYTNNTTEAKTTFGTAFNILNTSAYYLYLGKSVTFRDVSVTVRTYATQTNALIAQYWNGVTWATLSVTDNTANFQNSGTITYSLPGDWATTSVNSQTNYWIRFALTSTPTTVPALYNIRPGSNKTLAVMSSNGDAVATTPNFTVENDGRALQNGVAIQPPATITVATISSRGGHNADFVCPGAKDQECINKAIAALPAGGGTIVLLDGTYNLTGSITPLPQNLRITGMGMGATKLVMSNISVATIFDTSTYSSGNPLNNLEVDHLEIDRDADTKDANTSRKAIFVQYLNRANFHDIYAHGSGGTCFGVDLMQNSKIQNNVLINCGTSTATTGSSGIGIGTGAYASESNIITGNHITTSGLSCILIEAQSGAIDSNNFIVDGNTCLDSNQYGIFIRGASTISMEGNIIKGALKDGIRVETYQSIAPANISVQGGTINTSSLYGIRLASSGITNVQVKNVDLCGNTSGTILSSISDQTELARWGNTCDTLNFMPGNVGIGSTTPRGVLDIGSGSYYGDGSHLSGISPGGSSQWQTSGVGISTVNAVGVGTYTWGSKLTVLGGVGVGTVGSSNYVTGAAPTGSIIAETNVGVGTVLPTAQLELFKTSTVDFLRASSVLNGDVLIVTNGGNVGVGSTNPGAAVDVNGTVRATTITASGAGLGTIANSAGISIDPANSTFTTGLVNILTNGNLGVGTTVPVQALEVVGTIKASTDVKIGAQSVCQANGTNCPAGGTNPWLNVAASGNVGIATYGSVGIGTTSGNNASLIVFGGNVGIGTINPGGILDLGATSNFRVSTAGIITKLNNNAVSISDTTLTFSANSATTILNSSSGSSAAMKITGGANAASGITIQTTSSGSGGTSDKVVVQGGNNGATEIIRFMGTGNTGLGSTAPGAKLDVQGGIRTSQGVVGQAACYRSDGTLGQCTGVVGVAGSCTCS